MATSHELLALPDDFDVLLGWLTSRGAVSVGRHAEAGTLVLHFPTLGDLTFWSSGAVRDYVASSPEWKAAVIAQIRSESDHVPQVNQLTSPVAGAVPPQYDQRGFWWSSSVWFPTRRLSQVFPELARLNGQLERWLRKHQLVFDNTKREYYRWGGDQLGGFDGIIRKVHALPSAAAYLAEGGTFVAYRTSDKVLAEFIRRRELAGRPLVPTAPGA